jgi:hypothetical protein
MPSPFTVNAIGSEVGVGGTGVMVDWDVETGSGVETEAHAENPSTNPRVKNIQTNDLFCQNIAPIIR